MTKTNLELLVAAQTHVTEADTGLKQIAEIGAERPVPAELFTLVMGHLRAANSAVMELEARARGVQPPQEG